MLPGEAGREERSADNEPLVLGADRLAWLRVSAYGLSDRERAIVNLVYWAQIALSLVVMFIGFYIALSRRQVLATTRAGGFGVGLLGLSYLVGGFEGYAVESLLLDRVEAYSALAGILVVLRTLVWQGRGR